MSGAAPAATVTDDADAPPDGEEEYEPRLWPLLAAEVLFLAAGFVGVAASLLGRASLLAEFSVRFRLAVLVFLAVEMLIPLVVYADLLRRPDDPDLEWVHATIMPVVNVLGAVAYFEERRRKLEGGSDEPVDESA